MHHRSGPDETDFRHPDYLLAWHQTQRLYALRNRVEDLQVAARTPWGALNVLPASAEGDLAGVLVIGPTRLSSRLWIEPQALLFP